MSRLQSNLRSLIPIPSLVLLLASGSVMAQQKEEGYQSPFRANYKRFTRGDETRVVDEAWGRHQWWLERVGGELSPEFYQHYIRQAELERAKYPMLFNRSGIELPTAVVPGAWVNLGPTTSDFTQNGVTLNKVDSGRSRTILPHPTDPNTVYYLNAGGGLWKTTNFESASPTWTPTTDFVGSTAGGAAAFGRTSSILYYGAGDSFDGGVGGFVIKSTDGASNWGTAVFLAGATRIHDLKVDTSIGGSDATDILLVGTNSGMFRSVDGGATFIPTGATSFSGKDVWTIVKTSAGWLASAETSAGVGALYLSTDQGLNWNPITNAGTIFTGAGRATLGIGAPGDSTVYCYAANQGNSQQLDLFKSTDGGQTWVALGLGTKTPTNPNDDQADMNIMADQAFYNHMLLVDPSDATRNTVYIGGQLSSAKTTNGGTTWTLSTNWLPRSGVTLPYAHADFHSAAFSSAGGTNRLFFGTDGGLFISSDGGTTWDDTKNKGLATHLIYALAVNPNVAGSALIGLQDNGTRTRVTSPAPSSTFNQIRGGDGFGVGWAPASGASLSSYVYNSIRRSTTNPPVDQNNWANFVSGLPARTSANFYFVTPIATPTAQADPSGQAFFTYSRSSVGKIYRSNALGWETIGSAGSGGITAGRGVRGVSHGIGVHPSDLNRIAAAGTSGYLMITTNGGQTWTEPFLGALPTAGLVSGWYGFNSNVAWATDKILYASSESTTLGAAHVAKSADGGTTWTRSDTGLPDLPVTKIAVDLGDGTGSTAYAATWLGVYRTTNGGTSWTAFGSGLPQGRVSDIYVAPDSSYIRVSTWGRGVWEMTDLPAAGTVDITPTSSFLYVGDTQTFTGTVNGGGGVTYAATGGTIDTAGLYTAGSVAGSFQVTASNAASPSQVAVANVIVAVPTPVTFPGQPSSTTAAVGHTATFSVTATGSGTLAYQWKKGGVAISGATTAAYTTPVLALVDTGSVYLCTVTGKAGAVDSNPATLTVSSLGNATTVDSTTVTAIPDAPSGGVGTPVEIPFAVSGVTGNVGEVTFSVYLTHTWVGDLDLTLVAPDNSTVTLARLINGGNIGKTDGSTSAFGTSCGTYTVFSDLAGSAIQTQTSANLPLVGTFRPALPLDAFNGKSPNGTWKLRIQDLGAVDTGSFRCGVLSVKPFAAAPAPSFNINGDGATDVFDLLEFLKLFGSASAGDLAKADFNVDGQINDADLTLLLNAF